jgi:flagellar biogenesis protein FliO
MNALKTLLATGLLASISAAAQAQAIESVTMTSDPADVVFTLRADKPLSMPSVRASEGTVRVRFPDADAPQSIQVHGDGAAIKLVDVRGGSNDSVMMRIDLGEQTKLASGDVRVENRKHIMVVRIARDVLPPLREPRIDEPKKLPPSTEQPKSAPLALPAPKEPVAAAQAETKPVSAPLALTTKKVVPAQDAKKPAPLSKVMAGPSASSPMPMLIGISAILALAYAVMRMLMTKKKGAEKARAPIDIVAQKRIGPRHQLVIVRAFGKEHLLSIQGGNTTLIAANEEIEDTFGDKLALVSREEPSIEPQANMIQNVAISQKSEPASRDTRGDLALATGGDMLRTAIQQRLSGVGRKKASDGGEKPASEQALSQAVAGLVRLRREAQL